MKIDKVTVNGKEVEFKVLMDKIIIDCSTINIDPVRGQIATAYYCKNEQGPKKWKIELRTKTLAKLLKKNPYIIWVATREDAERYIKLLDNELLF